MHSIGIMQGRLTPRKDRAIQFFPFESWDTEFHDAAPLGFQEIEWVFDAPDFEKNPLWSEAGCTQISILTATTGVHINTICADYFMVRPFFRTSSEERRERIAVLKRLCAQAACVHAQGIEIPLVDNSSIKTSEEEDILCSVLEEVLPDVRSHGLWIGLETDLPPEAFVHLLSRCDERLVKANYDSGNSSGLGYKPEEELAAYGERVKNIHIKDRLLGGTTVEPGTGNADFDALFRELAKVGYKGNFILQTARGEDGREKETLTRHKTFVEGYIAKYLTPTTITL